MTDDAAIRDRLEFVTKWMDYFPSGPPPTAVTSCIRTIAREDVPALLDRVAALEKAAADVLVYVNEGSDYDDERRDARALRALLDAAPSSAQEPEADVRCDGCGGPFDNFAIHYTTVADPMTGEVSQDEYRVCAACKGERGTG